MNVDEMDLVSQLKEAAPLRPQAYDRARARLRAAMAEPGHDRVTQLAPGTGTAVRGPRSSRARSHRRTLGTLGKAGIGAGIAAAAAAVAVVLAAAPATRPAAPGAAPRAGSASTAGSSLVSLAAYISAGSGSLPGNASLIIKTQVIGGQRMDVVYSLYTDSGAIYAGGDKATLMRAVARHQDLARSGRLEPRDHPERRRLARA